MPTTMRDFFETEEWATFKGRVEEGIRDRVEDILRFQVIPGSDAASNLAVLLGMLREVSTMRWLVERVPDILTGEEAKAYPISGEGGSYAPEGREDPDGGRYSNDE